MFEEVITYKHYEGVKYITITAELNYPIDDFDFDGKLL